MILHVALLNWTSMCVDMVSGLPIICSQYTKLCHGLGVDRILEGAIIYSCCTVNVLLHES